ncbi:MAG: oligosaccharide flippase family protein [Candidatus Levyibacteriota bacterium]
MEHLKIFKNTGYQIFTRVITSGVGFITTIILARYLGVLGYGDFTKVTAFVGLFYLIADFGFNAVFLQKDTKTFPFKNLFFLRLAIALVLVFLVNGIAFLLPFNKVLNLGFSQSVRLGIMIFSLSIISQAILFSSSAIFQKKLSYQNLAKSTAVGSLITLLLIAVFVFYSLPLSYFLWAFVIGGFISAIISLILTREDINFFSRSEILLRSTNFAAIKRFFIESSPIGLMLIFNLVYFRIDIFLLSFLKSTTDVGVYGLAYKFFDFLITLPLFLSNSIYPSLIVWQKNYRKLIRFSKIYVAVFLFVSIITLIVFWFLAPFIVLVKKEFFLSVLPFRILLLSLPLFFLTSILQWILISQKQQKFLMLIYSVCASLNIILNIIFIPIGSYIASAIITGVSEFFVLLALAIRLITVLPKLQGHETVASPKGL